MWEDADAKKPPRYVELGEDLERLSVAELEDRVDALNTEIERVRSKIAQKKASASAAHSVFKI